MIALVVDLVEVFLAGVGIERRSKGLVVVGTLMRIPLDFPTINHYRYTIGVVPIPIIIHDQSPFLIAPLLPIVYSRHMFRI